MICISFGGKAYWQFIVVEIEYKVHNGHFGQGIDLAYQIKNLTR